jgi:hypothetical protein
MHATLPKIFTLKSPSLLGSARAPRAVSGAPAGNSLQPDRSQIHAWPWNNFTRDAARRGRRSEHARRVRAPII